MNHISEKYTSAAEKRRRLRASLDTPALQVFIGAFSPLVACLIEEMAFDGIYVGSSTLSADLALPDIELITQTEATTRGQAIARSVSLPTILDIDTGYGSAINVARTIKEAEHAGISGCHLEDQESPKRCGHLENKRIIEPAIMLEKIAAAVAVKHDRNFLIIARTDARAIEGLNSAIERAKLYIAAGADVIFPDALESVEEFTIFRKEIDKPLIANMTEFGKSPLLSSSQLEELGYNIAIYPATTLRLSMHAIQEGLTELKAKGNQKSLLKKMQNRQRLYDLVKYNEYGEIDKNVSDFFKSE